MQRHKHTDSEQHEFPNPGAAKPTRNLLQQLPSLRPATHGQQHSPRSSKTAQKTCRKETGRAGLLRRGLPATRFYRSVLR